MKRIIATLLAMLMLFAALASAEALKITSRNPVFRLSRMLPSWKRWTFFGLQALCASWNTEIAWIKQNETGNGHEVQLAENQF